MKRYTLPELRAMKHCELVAIAPDGVKITKNVNKGTAIKRIMRAYSDASITEHVDDLERAEEAGELSETPMPGSPDFELLATMEEAGEERRGGAREGSGRPKGMTAKKARMSGLPDLPNEIILLTVTAAFDLWAKQSGVREVALSVEEAVELALPLTRLAEYYGLTQYLPEEIMLWVAPVWAFSNIVKSRRKMIVDVKGGGTDAEPASKDNDGVREAGKRQDNESAGTDKAPAENTLL